MHTQGDTKLHNFVISCFVKSQLLQVFYDKLNYSILWLWSSSSRDLLKKLFVSFKQLNRNVSFDPILKNYVARKCGVKRGKKSIGYRACIASSGGLDVTLMVFWCYFRKIVLSAGKWVFLKRFSPLPKASYEMLSSLGNQKKIQPNF